MSQSKTNHSISRTKFIHPEKCTHHALLLLYLFRDEKELLSSFEPYGDLVDQTFSQFNEKLITNQET